MLLYLTQGAFKFSTFYFGLNDFIRRNATVCKKRSLELTHSSFVVTLVGNTLKGTFRNTYEKAQISA